ncbi:pyruvate oxidase [Lacticaseibacillus thailandensis DSM 22698 = JCM 13996]|uniref:Pyruvate oxidase n=2 Tax=Lacticaseibacillus thailandensis TaxID=381741 RepID=A0A0R2C402_9LACO|nr:pyruvate oxidase [Lacticaseibacillus thailandensis DSM 22698 = JCM 13996]
MLRVLEAWGVDHVYGYPGGSFNSTMAALDDEKERIRYIQIRHEQVGAFAAAADAKLTGKIGVAFGSAGPGATNLLTGLYDAREDHAPVLALVGQVPHTNMNYDYFQEFDEDPIFRDVAVYDRTVMTPESLPYVVDKAIRIAYQQRGVAVVIIPNDFGMVEIPDRPYASADAEVAAKPAPLPQPTTAEVDQALAMIKVAKRPVINVGQGIRDGGPQLVALSRKLQIPLVTSSLATGKVDPDYEGNLGALGRLGAKAANEIFGAADLAISLGADFPFARVVFESRPFKFIQVDTDRSKFGRRHHVDLGVWSDATSFVEQLLARSEPAAPSAFYQAAIADSHEWRGYLHDRAHRDTDPLEAESLYQAINDVAAPDAAFAVDVGDNSINAIRYLHLSPANKWTMSALFASMGTALPGAIAAQLDFPDRQVFSISGDGAFSMVMQDLITEKKYHLPIINVVTSNTVLGFIKGEQDDVNMAEYSGIDLADQDFAQIAAAMGIQGATVRKTGDLQPAFARAVAASKAGEPFLIDAKITANRTFATESLIVNVHDGQVDEFFNPAFNSKHDAPKVQTLADFFAYFDAASLHPLRYFFDNAGVQL